MVVGLDWLLDGVGDDGRDLHRRAACIGHTRPFDVDRLHLQTDGHFLSEEGPEPVEAGLLLNVHNLSESNDNSCLKRLNVVEATTEGQKREEEAEKDVEQIEETVLAAAKFHLCRRVIQLHGLVLDVFQHGHGAIDLALVIGFSFLQ